MFHQLSSFFHLLINSVIIGALEAAIDKKALVE